MSTHDDYGDPSASVRHLIAPLQRFLDADGVTDVVMNRPGEVFLYCGAGCECIAVPDMDFDRCMALAAAAATFSTQVVADSSPLLEAALPGGQRLGLVMPPACTRDTVALVIRRPPGRIITLDEMEKQGLFSRVVPVCNGLQEHERRLLELKRDRQYKQFLIEAIRYRKTIVVSGHTGSGKTSILRALAEYIPLDRRLITIESAAEVDLPSHRNALHLFWSQGGQSVAEVTPRQLLTIALRLRPDIILLAEVRDDECFYFVRAAASGHPGSMTTLHAASPALAIEQMALMIRQSSAGAGLTFSEIKRLLLLTIDVIVQFCNDGEGRFVQEIFYDPELKQRLAAEGGQ
jgi:type IV secretion system protein VirB11